MGMLILLTGCSGIGNTNLKEPDNSLPESSVLEQEVDTEPKETGPENEADFPGTYTVPDGWVKAEEHSTNDMTFYMEEGHENDALPDNISLSVGACPYTLEESASFRDAIMSQLAMQLRGSDAQLSGNGSETTQGYVLYDFTIEDTDGTITELYYILKDYGFCLVQVTSFTGSENEGIFEAAQSIVDSFVWNEDSQ